MTTNCLPPGPGAELGRSVLFCHSQFRHLGTLLRPLQLALQDDQLTSYLQRQKGWSETDLQQPHLVGRPPGTDSKAVPRLFTSVGLSAAACPQSWTTPNLSLLGPRSEADRREEGRAETMEAGRRGTELLLARPTAGTTIPYFSQTALKHAAAGQKAIWSVGFPTKSDKRHRIPQDLLALWKIEFPAK